MRGTCLVTVVCVLAAVGCDVQGSQSDVGAADAGANDAAAADGCNAAWRADVVEGQPLTTALACADGSPLPGDAELEAAPSGASYDARRSELRWVPGFDQAGRHELELRSGSRTLGRFEIDVLDAFADPDNQPLVDPERYLTEYGLPVIHLGVSPNVNDDTHETATFVYGGHTFTGVTAKYRGATSRKFPKRSYTVRFGDGDLFVDETRGFRGARRIVLTTTFDDNSYLRQRLAYGLWNRLSDSHIPIRAFNAVVFVDGQYRGVYVVSDHIDDDFLDDAGVYGHGNLYKAREHDANLRLEDEDGDPKPNLHVGYTKEEGTPGESEPAAFEDLDQLVEWIATAPDAEFAAEYDRRMVRSEFEDWLIFVCTIQGTDSAGKNSYLYHDPRGDAPEPRWRYLPWDFNASLGQGYRTQRREITDYPLSDFSLYNELFERMLRDPALRDRLERRFDEALNTVWKRDDVLALYDDWSESIAPSALRDEQRWGDVYRDFWDARTDLTDYEGERAYVRAWIEGRWAFLQSSLDGNSVAR